MPDVIQVWDAELAYTHTSLNPDRAGGAGVIDGAEPLWCVYAFQPSAGMEIHHAFPHSALEQRCAEYGFDPDDVDTLLDVVMYEPYIPPLNDPFAREDPAVAKILDQTHGLPTCWTPGVSDDARRAAHLARIAAVKEHRVVLEAAPQQLRADALTFVGSDRTIPADPLEPIRSLVRLDPVRVQGRRLAVEWIRANAERPAQPTFHLKPPATFVGVQPR